MTRLEEKMAGLKQQGRKGLFIYLMAGAPDEDTTIAAIKAAERAGADVIELGMPFSDPLADGPVIQEAGQKALKSGMNMKKLRVLTEHIRSFTNLPLVGMGYTNQVLHYGLENFVTDFSAAGLDGAIIPDMPHEESAQLREIASAHKFHLIEFVTPGTTEKRITEICRSANGFIYAVSVNGVTGVRQQGVDYSIIGKVTETVKKHTDVPLGVGFGIGSPEAAVSAAAHGEAVIVGSAVVRRLLDRDLKGAEQLIASMRQALDQQYGKA